VTKHKTSVTAPSGAGPSSTGSTTGPPEDFRGPNERMRYAYLECNLRIQQARAAGDADAERRARADREKIATQFMAKNTRLAQSVATPLMINKESSAELLQAALLGLWEAFVGTDPAGVDGVRVDEDGGLHPVAGWDPRKGTFATWASRHIAGRARRSVCASEGAFSGMGYHTWGKRPEVVRAKAALTEELGHTPSVAQIAERTGLTEATVRACLTGPPSSLDALISEDSTTKVSDRLVVETDDTVSTADTDAAAFARLAHGARGLDLMVLLLREGVLETGPRTVVQTADRLGIGRGSVAPAVHRARAAMGLPRLHPAPEQASAT